MDISEHLAAHEAVLVSVARKIAWRYRLGRHAWKDLAQEAREELIRAHNGRYDHDRASLLSYAWRGIHWRLEAVAQDFISNTNPTDGQLFDKLESGKAEDVLMSDPDLWAAWNQLAEAERTTLRLYAIHPRLKDAAVAAGVSVPTFRKRKDLAASKCRRLYYGGEDVGVAKRRGRPRGPRLHAR
jgi:DNA-directed RNA polymerase specialized sigma24 family protein